MNLQQDIEQLKTRNIRVEKDKKWENSLFRKILILVFTYGGALVFLLIIEAHNPFLAAVVPSIGYWLSTLRLQWIRNKYEKFKKN
jgi:hypothetical protein